MAFIRSLIFIIIFYISTILQVIIFLPVFFLSSQKTTWSITKLWARINNWLFSRIIGVKIIIEGIENLPPAGTSYLIAPKHQSAWDTFGFFPILDHPSLILKQELLRIPLFGLFVKKTGMIAINRQSPLKALKTITKEAQIKINQGRQILIYPEGTRKTPGEEPSYKSGIVNLYKNLNVPVIIIAHNAGLFWSAKKFTKYGGTLRCKILPALPSDMDPKDFFNKLIELTETSCNELLIETASQPDCPPLPESAVNYLQQKNIDYYIKNK
ncbi:lysophospholipid acyltransferase family protein [Bartonella sp. DGB1]|uniref:lysophospholipid acyltransferase family protein n=1 Tax=Bartonella sp. DGB1 TaxID=3239807 RepID=UPI00352395BE